MREAIALLKGLHPRSATAMRDLLTASEFCAYKQELDGCFPRPALRERDVLNRYNVDLRRGDTLHARATKLPSVGLQAMKRSLMLAEVFSCYCRAHEMLGELLCQNPLLSYLFDRPWNDGDGQMEEPEGMPRRTNAASEHVRQAPQQPETAAIAQTQRAALINALAELDRTGERIDSNVRYIATSRAPRMPPPDAMGSASDVAEFRGVLVQRSGRRRRG